MNFDKLHYLFFSIPLLITFLILFWKSEKSFFEWVKDYWFLERSKASKASLFMFFMALILLALSFGDLRGKERIIEGQSVKSKTLILIDSSASMLAEDVRPNRFEKGLLLAKHYLRKAVGHEVSIVVFSDQQKRIVPFTEDMNLIEARLSTLEDLSIGKGGSNISQALLEAEKYFVTPKGIGLGNILLITDGEENENVSNFELAPEISLAVLAVGTSKGGTIPLRDSRGKLRGNKKYRGKDVITKINEGYLKSLGQNVSNYKYWITSSYSLPTEEVLRFFNRALKEKTEKGNVRVKPVLYEYLLVPALIFLILSYFLKFFKSFHMINTMFLIFISTSVSAQVGRQTPSVEEEKEKSSEVIELEERFARDELNMNEKKHLAQKLLSEEFFDQSALLYNELLNEPVDEKNKLEFFNQGVAEFQSGNIEKGIGTYNKLIDYLENNKQTETQTYKDVKKNLLKALQVQEEQKSKSGKSENSEQNQKNNQDQQNQNGQENSDQQNNDQDQQSQSGNQQSNDQDGNQDPEDKDQGKQGSKNKEDEKDGKGSKDKNKKNPDGKDDEKEKEDNKDKGAGNGNDAKEKKKIPALLKQLMSDDNQLQKKMIDAKTNDRKARDRKDW